MSAEPLIDRRHLDAQTFGDADLAREVLGLFEAQCRRLLPALADEARPPAERADLAHTLKGAALGVGAARVAAASAALEASLRRGEPRAGSAEPSADLAEAVAATLREVGAETGADL